MANFIGTGSLSYAAGGTCYRCHRNDGLVDCDVHITAEGTLALCKGCITDLAEAASLTFNDAYVQELRSALETEKAAREHDQRLLDELQVALGWVARAK